MRYTGIPKLVTEYRLLSGDLLTLDDRIDEIRAGIAELPQLEAERAEKARIAESIAMSLRHLDPTWQAPDAAFRRKKTFPLNNGTMARAALGELRTASKPLSAKELAAIVTAKLLPNHELTAAEMNRAAQNIRAVMIRTDLVVKSGQKPNRFSVKR